MWLGYSSCRHLRANRESSRRTLIHRTRKVPACARGNADRPRQTHEEKRDVGPHLLEFLARPRAARGLGGVGIIGPVVFRVPSLEILLHLVVAALPEAH